MNFQIDEDEVILYEGSVLYEKDSSDKSYDVDLTLTSKKMIFEQEKGFFKKQKQLFDIVNLSDIKIFNDEVQCKQKLDELQIQTNNKAFSISFDGILEAKKVYNKIINTITGTTMAKRGSDKVKSALDLVDETLGLDTRGVARGLLENGIKGTLINGIKKRRK